MCTDSVCNCATVRRYLTARGDTPCYCASFSNFCHISQNKTNKQNGVWKQVDRWCTCVCVHGCSSISSQPPVSEDNEMCTPGSSYAGEWCIILQFEFQNCILCWMLIAWGFCKNLKLKNKRERERKKKRREREKNFPSAGQRTVPHREWG